jgi:hypothetical protein
MGLEAAPLPLEIRKGRSTFLGVSFDIVQKYTDVAQGLETLHEWL